MRRARKLVADIRKLDHCVLVSPQDSVALGAGPWDSFVGHKQYHKTSVPNKATLPRWIKTKRRLFHSHI